MRIAIIEDEATISQMYKVKFENCGYEVEIAENGREGLDLVERFNPDVILLDLVLPDIDGDVVLRRIRAHDWGKHIPTIVLTNISPEESPETLDSLDVANYIHKIKSTPGQVVELIRAIAA
jgi:DNA-binding response OmpR family regulator